MPLRALAGAAALALAAALAAALPAAGQSPSPLPQPAPAVAPQGAIESPMKDSLAHARRLVRLWNAGQVDSLMAFVAPQDRERITRDRVLGMIADLAARVGEEQEVIEEKFVKRNGQTQYWRTAKYSLAPEPMLMRWVFDAQGHVLGQGFGPASQAPAIDP